MKCPECGEEVGDGTDLYEEDIVFHKFKHHYKNLTNYNISYIQPTEYEI